VIENGQGIRKIEGIGFVHWECFKIWPARLSYAESALNDHEEPLKINPFYDKVLRTKWVLISVMHLPAKALVHVFLNETLTFFRMPLSEWEDWVSQIEKIADRLDPIESEVLLKAMPEIVEKIPDETSLLNAIDYELKQKKKEAWEKERAEAERQWKVFLREVEDQRNKIKAIEQSPESFQLKCPYCKADSKNIRFVNPEDESRWAYFICQACGRSFQSNDSGDLILPDL
jgi:hypothetical protein